MIKAITFGLAAVASAAGALSLVTPGDANYGPATVVAEVPAAANAAQPAPVRLAQAAVGQTNSLDYQRGPRIIHVPQPGDASRPATGTSSDRRSEPAVTDDNDDDDEVVAPPLPRPRVSAPKSRAVATPQPPAAVTPRWKLRNDPSPPPPEPPPSGPRRAVLSAPPPAAEGLPPLRPTPRFDGKAASGEKFAIPGEPARPSPMISETSPPIGYTPPTTPLPEN